SFWAAMSDSRPTRSQPVLSRRLPSRVKQNPDTSPFVCPCQEASDSYVPASHKRISPTPSPATTRLPSGEKATADKPVLCPESVAKSSPLAASKRRTWRSKQAVATFLPSGE